MDDGKWTMCRQNKSIDGAGATGLTTVWSIPRLLSRELLFLATPGASEAM
jgi:hypothetical protein